MDKQPNKKKQKQLLPSYSKALETPCFFPDATFASIHSLPHHLVEEKLDGVVITTLHLRLLGVEEEVAKTGSINHFFSFPNRLVTLSDSGGYQILSLISRRGLGKIKEIGAKFKKSEVVPQPFILTPELSQDIQHNLNTDIRVTLDIPMEMIDEYTKVKRQLERTTRWAARSKSQFLKNLHLTEKLFDTTHPTKNKNSIEFIRPLLCGVVQGGSDVDLRKESGRQLAEIGFDIYGFGGWAVDEDGTFSKKVTEAFLSGLPQNAITYGMGVGTPDDIAFCYSLGINIFDCVLPTRNARHGLLYVSKGNAEKGGDSFDVLRINHTRYHYDQGPIDPECDCPTCKHYARTYLRFLLKKKNPVGFTLVTLHNVWWYLSFMQKLRENT